MAILQGDQEVKLHLESITWENLTWINIENATERETKYLSQHYPFHPLDLDDTLSRKQRPKIDEYKDYIFSILHFQVYNKERRVSSHTQLSVFIGENYLVTLHTGQLKALQQLFQECRTEQGQRENFSYGSGYLLYRIFDRLVDSYAPILDKILAMMEEIEDKVFDENIDAAKELSILRRDIITQRRIVLPLRTVIGSLEGKLKRFTRIDMSVYYGDLMDHMNQACETLDECKEIIEVFKDTDFILGTDRLNRIMRIMTILGTILLPFLVVSSLWGMNVVLPGGLSGEGYNLSFFIILLATSAIAGAMLLIFHRKRWI